eukprot:9470787-Pyramimonas_sp.AAC.2
MGERLGSEFCIAAGLGDATNEHIISRSRPAAAPILPLARGHRVREPGLRTTWLRGPETFGGVGDPRWGRGGCAAPLGVLGPSEKPWKPTRGAREPWKSIGCSCAPRGQRPPNGTIRIT